MMTKDPHMVMVRKTITSAREKKCILTTHRYWIRLHPSVVVVPSFEEGIIQGYRLDPFHVDVPDEVRIYVEEDWHIHCFPGS